MARAPLMLEHSLFKKFIVDSNSSYFEAKTKDEAKCSDSPDKINIELSMAQHDEDKSRYKLDLRIYGLKSEDKLLPYDLDVEIVGFFRVDPEFSHDRLEHLVRVNGASILYGSVREQVLTISGRSLNGAFSLPTINMAAHLSESN